MKYLSLIILSAFCMWGCKAKKPLAKDLSLYKRYDHIGDNENYYNDISGTLPVGDRYNGLPATFSKGTILLSNDTIPKKDTIPAELFTMPYMDKGIDPPSFGLEAPRYDYFYCEREVKAIRKELDSLKIEIQKLKQKPLPKDTKIFNLGQPSSGILH